MELNGRWRLAQATEELRRSFSAPDFDDAGWVEADVPGHWRSTAELASDDGPVLYRRRFEATPGGRRDGRAFLVFDGIFYQGDVWLDGEYLGDTEGYFFPHEFEVTAALEARRDHVLAVEVGCSRPDDLEAKRNLTGVFQHWDCIDPDWNPGGIWAGVGIRRSGPVRIAALEVVCPEATAERAVLELEVELDSAIPGPVTMETTVSREDAREPAAVQDDEQVLSAGVNVVRWRMAVERPDLWWPRALGSQPLYQVAVQISVNGSVSDRRTVTTGLRQVRLRDFVATVNGERLFLKGGNYGPLRRDVAAASPADFERDVRLAVDAGLDLLRVHAHVSRPELYDAADRAGLLIWQDLPLQWGYARVRRQAVAQARKAVQLLGHHPSVALWCGHNEPIARNVTPGPALSVGRLARVLSAQVLPTRNKTILDRSIRRALERADGSRAVITHSGVVPHPAWGTDTHLYFGWYHGEERDLPGLLARLPVLARFVSEFGAQAVPESAEFMEPSRWPDLDWDRLEQHHSLQKAVFDSRVPPADYPTFDAWRAATQAYQAAVLRHHIETLRRLKYRPSGGFCFFMLSDAQPAVTWSVLDHRRVPKAAYAVVAAACAPVIITADRPQRSYRPGDHVELAVHAVSDLRVGIDAGVDAAVTWPGGSRRWRFGGRLEADSCALVGRLAFEIPIGTPAGELAVTLSMAWAGGRAQNSYESLVQPV